MCNVDCFQWIANNITIDEVKNKKVVEVGSFNVNGSLRAVIEMLDTAEYIGTDIVEGPGVDEVCPAQDLVKKFGDNSFGIVVSTCVLKN